MCERWILVFTLREIRVAFAYLKMDITSRKLAKIIYLTAHISNSEKYCSFICAGL